MNKHFLVTISNEIENLSGVEFLCSFFKKESEHNLTLLHICRLDANDMNASLMEMWEKPDDKIKGRLTFGARKAIDKSIQTDQYKQNVHRQDGNQDRGRAFWQGERHPQ